MSHLTTERRHLEQANSHIAGGESRISAQIKLIGRLRSVDQDTAEAEALLYNLRETLVTWNDHRNEIVREIARLEQTSPE